MLTGIYRSPVAKPAIVILLLLVVLPFILPQFYTYILALIFVTALLAMSLNLVLGYGGLYQFHHAVFYGVGAYAVALLITRAGWPAWLSFLVAPFFAALVGFLIGWFCIRLTKLYFGMLQISLGSLIWVIVFRWYDVTGGDNGIHDIPMPALISSISSSYYFVLAVATLSILLMYRIVKSPFGATLQAIRDNPQRCEAIGVNVRNHQLLAIVVASFFAGVSGVLFVGLERTVFPGMLFWSLSLEVFVMCLLGGWYTFPGPIIGAGLIVALRTFVSIYTDYWTMILGILLILLIFFLPDGVMGFLLERFRPRSSTVDDAAGELSAVQEGSGT